MQWKYTLQAGILEKLLPILDDLDLAMSNQPEELQDSEWVGGIMLITHKLQSQLEETGLKEIDALGQPFDPEIHEAVMQREDPGAESGTVIEVMRRGYYLGEHVLRPAMVIVAM